MIEVHECKSVLQERMAIKTKTMSLQQAFEISQRSDPEDSDIAEIAKRYMIINFTKSIQGFKHKCCAIYPILILMKKRTSQLRDSLSCYSQLKLVFKLAFLSAGQLKLVLLTLQDDNGIRSTLKHN